MEVSMWWKKLALLFGFGVWFVATASLSFRQLKITNVEEGDPVLFWSFVVGTAANAILTFYMICTHRPPKFPWGRA